MRQKSGPQTSAAENTIKDICRATRKHHSVEDEIHIVLEGQRGEDSIAAICRRGGIAESLYYSWSKELLEAGKKRLAGETARSATSDELKAPRRESRYLKEALADVTLENRLLNNVWPAPLAIGLLMTLLGRARIRHSGTLALAMMEIRAFWSS